MPHTRTVNARALRLKAGLLRLATKEIDPELSLHIKRLALLTRIVFEGLTQAEIRGKLLHVFEEFSDGDMSLPLNIDDLEEETGMQRALFGPVLVTMLERGEVLADARLPDYHQYGNHSKESFRLNPEFKGRKKGGTPRRPPQFKIVGTKAGSPHAVARSREISAAFQPPKRERPPVDPEAFFINA